MQKYFYSPNTKDRIKGAFGGKNSLVGRAMPRFPESAEREYIRAVNQYMRSVKTIIEAEMPTLQDEYRKQLNEKDLNMDGVFDFASFITNFFLGITSKLDKMGATGVLVKKLRKIGAITKKQEIAEWRRMVKKTLGVNLAEDYYSGEFFDSLLEEWVSDNVDLIKTVPHDMLGDMKKLIAEGYEKGLSATEISKGIQERYAMSKSHAQFIARDQMSKLTGQITRKQHEDAGVTRYQWSTSQDSRVRPGHALLEGQIFEYANPPEIIEWRDTKTGGYWISTGRHCNPQEDYNCRCVALPVFDNEALTLPLEDDKI